MSSDDTLFARLGGAPAVHAIIEEFVNRMVGDLMIGFFFKGVNLTQLIEHEYQFTARFLGANIAYEGRTLRNAHAVHRIMGGQFARRRQILIDVLQAHQVPDDIASDWVAHVDALRDQVTTDAADTCD